MNCKIMIQYDGTRYDGWQRQGNTDNTIQGKLEKILTRMSGYPIEIHGAGRTDAGVHALGQTANFHLTERADPVQIKMYLNQYLPDDIEVTDVSEVPDRFHSRLNACDKTYAYRIGTDEFKAVFERKYRYHYGEHLDVSMMKKAASYCLGTHDFKGFCGNKRIKKSTVRTLEEICFEQKEHDLVISYTGNGFLYHMVRILTGTLIEIGGGKRPPEDIKKILEEKNRQLAGFTAPAMGLTLLRVRYEK
ncbi:tRNA pseudouridine(38-40) synthase TruA [Ruminococcus sp. OA3]|uniref:tRNA pseudouridine(38-40) synthase TruA n=1 Tax=Ruminococcus sp. OA3 TaxID=2914164 RepID=UPI001F067AD2|nr:tRNA pseudouridine(38-40) synthase TruA [Ruminococcus sp. OA3]MCH1983945.1 tRNA pseudouridine(38-40) synthase TruA [Ruminococcus sp. OA3]